MFAAATPEVTCFADARYALIGGTGTDPDELRAMISDLAGQPGVAAYDFKDPSRFMEELAGFDIVALPYDEASYAHRPSTILIEACGLGVVPVVTPNTWLADFCREHSVGVVAEASTPQALVDAVRCATDDLTEMKRDLAERNHAWRQEFSVERLFDQLVEISAEH